MARDGKPEAMIGLGYYRDTGCEVAPACLACPLPVCRYDVPGGLRAIENEERNAGIVEAAAAGVGAGRIAEAFGITPRQVNRILGVSR